MTQTPYALDRTNYPVPSRIHFRATGSLVGEVLLGFFPSSDFFSPNFCISSIVKFDFSPAMTCSL